MVHQLIRKTAFPLLCLLTIICLAACGRGVTFEDYFARHQEEYACFTVEQQTVKDMEDAAFEWCLLQQEGGGHKPVVLRFHTDQAIELVAKAHQYLLAHGMERIIWVAQGETGETIIPMETTGTEGGWGAGGEEIPVPGNVLGICALSTEYGYSITLRADGEVTLHDKTLLPPPDREPGKTSRYDLRKLDAFLDKHLAPPHQLHLDLRLQRADMRDILALLQQLSQHKGLVLDLSGPYGDDAPPFEDYFPQHRDEYATGPTEDRQAALLVFDLDQPAATVAGKIIEQNTCHVILDFRMAGGELVIPAFHFCKGGISALQPTSGWGAQGTETLEPKSQLRLSSVDTLGRAPSILYLTLTGKGEVVAPYSSKTLAASPTRKQGRLSCYNTEALHAELSLLEGLASERGNGLIVRIQLAGDADMRDLAALLQELRRHKNIVLRLRTTSPDI